MWSKIGKSIEEVAHGMGAVIVDPAPGGQIEFGPAFKNGEMAGFKLLANPKGPIKGDGAIFPTPFPQYIQDYCRELSIPLVEYFLEKNTPVDDEKHRAHHLMGMQLPKGTDGETLVEELQRRKVFVSLRGANIRISVNVFNTEEDIAELIAALDS